MQVQSVNLENIQKTCAKEHKAVKKLHSDVIDPALAKIQKGFFGTTKITLDKKEKITVLKKAEEIEKRKERANSSFRNITKLIRKLKKVNSKKEPYRYNRIQRRLLSQQEKFEYDLSKIYEHTVVITTKIIAAKKIAEEDKKPFEDAKKSCEEFIQTLKEKSEENRKKLNEVKQVLSENLKEKIGLDLFSETEFPITLRLDAENKRDFPRLHKTIQKLKRYSGIAKIEDEIAQIDQQLKAGGEKSALNFKKVDCQLQSEGLKAKYIKELFNALNEVKGKLLENPEQSERLKKIIEAIDKELVLLSKKYEKQFDVYEKACSSYEAERASILSESRIKRSENFFIYEENRMSLKEAKLQKNLLQAAKSRRLEHVRRGGFFRPGRRMFSMAEKSPDEKKYLSEIYGGRVKTLCEILKKKRNDIFEKIDQDFSSDDASLKLLKIEINRLEKQCELLLFEMRQIENPMPLIGITFGVLPKSKELEELSYAYFKEKKDYISKITKPYRAEIKSLESLSQKVGSWLEKNREKLPTEKAESLKKVLSDAHKHRWYTAHEEHWKNQKSSARNQRSEMNKVRMEAKYMFTEVILEEDKIKHCRALLDELSSAVARTESEEGKGLLDDILKQYDAYFLQARERKESYTTFIDSIQKEFPQIYEQNRSLKEIGPLRILIGKDWGSDRHTRLLKDSGALKNYELTTVSHAIERKYNILIACLAEGQLKDSVSVHLLEREIRQLEDLFTKISNETEPSSKRLVDTKNLIVGFQKSRIQSLENSVTIGQLTRLGDQAVQMDKSKLSILQSQISEMKAIQKSLDQSTNEYFQLQKKVSLKKSKRLDAKIQQKELDVIRHRSLLLKRSHNYMINLHQIFKTNQLGTEKDLEENFQKISSSYKIQNQQATEAFKKLKGLKEELKDDQPLGSIWLDKPWTTLLQPAKKWGDLYGDLMTEQFKAQIQDSKKIRKRKIRNKKPDSDIKKLNYKIYRNHILRIIEVLEGKYKKRAALTNLEQVGFPPKHPGLQLVDQEIEILKNAYDHYFAKYKKLVEDKDGITFDPIPLRELRKERKEVDKKNAACFKDPIHQQTIQFRESISKLEVDKQTLLFRQLEVLKSEANEVLSTFNDELKLEQGLRTARWLYLTKKNPQKRKLAKLKYQVVELQVLRKKSERLQKFTNALVLFLSGEHLEIEHLPENLQQFTKDLKKALDSSSREYTKIRSKIDKYYGRIKKQKLGKMSTEERRLWGEVLSLDPAEIVLEEGRPEEGNILYRLWKSVPTAFQIRERIYYFKNEQKALKGCLQDVNAKDVTAREKALGHMKLPQNVLEDLYEIEKEKINALRESQPSVAKELLKGLVKSVVAKGMLGVNEGIVFEEKVDYTPILAQVGLSETSIQRIKEYQEELKANEYIETCRLWHLQISKVYTVLETRLKVQSSLKKQKNLPQSYLKQVESDIEFLRNRYLEFFKEYAKLEVPKLNEKAIGILEDTLEAEITLPVVWQTRFENLEELAKTGFQGGVLLPLTGIEDVLAKASQESKEREKVFGSELDEFNKNEAEFIKTKRDLEIEKNELFSEKESIKQNLRKLKSLQKSKKKLENQLEGLEKKDQNSEETKTEMLQKVSSQLEKIKDEPIKELAELNLSEKVHIDQIKKALEFESKKSQEICLKQATLDAEKRQIEILRGLQKVNSNVPEERISNLNTKCEKVQEELKELNQLREDKLKTLQETRSSLEEIRKEILIFEPKAREKQFLLDQQAALQSKGVDVKNKILKMQELATKIEVEIGALPTKEVFGRKSEEVVVKLETNALSLSETTTNIIETRSNRNQLVREEQKRLEFFSRSLRKLDATLEEVRDAKGLTQIQKKKEEYDEQISVLIQKLKVKKEDPGLSKKIDLLKYEKKLLDLQEEGYHAAMYNQISEAMTDLYLSVKGRDVKEKIKAYQEVCAKEYERRNSEARKLMGEKLIGGERQLESSIALELSFRNESRAQFEKNIQEVGAMGRCVARVAKGSEAVAKKISEKIGGAFTAAVGKVIGEAKAKRVIQPSEKSIIDQILEADEPAKYTPLGNLLSTTSSVKGAISYQLGVGFENTTLALRAKIREYEILKNQENNSEEQKNYENKILIARRAYSSTYLDRILDVLSEKHLRIKDLKKMGIAEGAPALEILKQDAELLEGAYQTYLTEYSAILDTITSKGIGPTFLDNAWDELAEFVKDVATSGLVGRSNNSVEDFQNKHRFALKGFTKTRIIEYFKDNVEKLDGKSLPEKLKAVISRLDDFASKNPVAAARMAGNFALTASVLFQGNESMLEHAKKTLVTIAVVGEFYRELEKKGLYKELPPPEDEELFLYACSQWSEMGPSIGGVISGMKEAASHPMAIMAPWTILAGGVTGYVKANVIRSTVNRIPVNMAGVAVAGIQALQGEDIQTIARTQAKLHLIGLAGALKKGFQDPKAFVNKIVNNIKANWGMLKISWRDSRYGEFLTRFTTDFALPISGVVTPTGLLAAGYFTAAVPLTVAMPAAAVMFIAMLTIWKAIPNLNYIFTHHSFKQYDDARIETHRYMFRIKVEGNAEKYKKIDQESKKYCAEQKLSAQGIRTDRERRGLDELEKYHRLASSIKKTAQELISFQRTCLLLPKIQIPPLPDPLRKEPLEKVAAKVYKNMVYGHVDNLNLTGEYKKFEDEKKKAVEDGLQDYSRLKAKYLETAENDIFEDDRKKMREFEALKRLYDLSAERNLMKKNCLLQFFREKLTSEHIASGNNKDISSIENAAEKTWVIGTIMQSLQQKWLQKEIEGEYWNDLADSILENGVDVERNISTIQSRFKSRSEQTVYKKAVDVKDQDPKVAFKKVVTDKVVKRMTEVAEKGKNPIRAEQIKSAAKKFTAPGIEVAPLPTGVSMQG